MKAGVIRRLPRGVLEALLVERQNWASRVSASIHERRAKTRHNPSNRRPTRRARPWLGCTPMAVPTRGAGLSDKRPLRSHARHAPLPSKEGGGDAALHGVGERVELWRYGGCMAGAPDFGSCCITELSR